MKVLFITITALFSVLSHLATAEEGLGSRVRLMKNADGSTTEYKRDTNNTTLEKTTYKENQRGEKIIRSKTTYRRDKLGRLRAGIIEDGQRQTLYRIQYGYDRHTGRLVAENMYDARVRRTSPQNPTKETPIRALRYTYNAQGKRGKPVVYSALQGKTVEELRKYLVANGYKDSLTSSDIDADPFKDQPVNPNSRRLQSQ